MPIDKISFCITTKMNKQEAEAATIGYLSSVLENIGQGRSDCINWTMELDGKSAKWTRTPSIKTK